MQFTIATIVAFAAAAQAGPLAIRANTCNSAPAGPVNADVTPRSQPVAATADACQKLCEADSGCQSFVFGLPPSGTTPLCYLYAVPAAQVPPQSNSNLMVFDKACTSVPTAAPTQNNNNGAANNNGQENNNNNNNGQANNNGEANNGQAQQPKKRNVCGAAPTGPATNNPNPLVSRSDVASQDDCLALCRQTSGCQAIEFGKPSANEPVQCRLFNVPSSNLPAPTNGQTFVAFDIGC
ncbi:hypothetical protein CkaCkLH20_10589 [Colletotrichum karsti]|uniref:Apple domain-containing protein n=1 Tax=Colletotrichum karsti TaxID=1095194 RepID=A0A9P6HXN6_9PEZI|nr:uncharacterized protein CkaCkLH20_10589 [Colletotrichum karsti]KAF9871957.1 hypothetical protein CkaCkLH20_10589 [Colletotrichum karsti]